MTANKWVITAIIIALVAIAATAAYTVYNNQLTQAEQGRISPTPTRLSSNTPTQTPITQTGAQLFSQNCAGCHGSLSTTNLRGSTASQIQTAISNVGAMRSLSSLTSAQIQEITSALSSTVITPAPSTTAGTGASLYAQYCAGCHGQLTSTTKPNRTAAQIATAISSVGSMSSLSSLTTAQIQSIAAALASPMTTPAPTTSVSTGAQLYAQYCAGCHNPLTSSTKIGRTASQITSAINNVGSMNSLSSLSTTQIQAIATALVSPSSSPSPSPSLPPDAQVYSNGQYRVIAWNDLGMHCYNPSFKDIGVLPPYNNLWAQVIRLGEEPQIVTSGVSVSYRIIDNTYSVGKTDFWSYEDKLFGTNLPDNIGLTGAGLTGTMVPTASAQNGRADHFEVDGVPLTEYRDSATNVRYPFMLAVIEVKNLQGTLLARTTVVAPVSTEMTCNNCHGDTGIATTKYPITPTGKVDTNILTLHDYLHPSTPSRMNSRPVLCANCHSSNALGLTGLNGVPSLSNSMHSAHATGAGITSDTNGCYNCHPGPTTKCLRDVMSTQFGMTCISCHGTMSQVAANTNPWLNEPRCDSSNCHPSTTTRLNNPLFRKSTAMGGIYCEACHGPTHAIAPTTQANDAIQVMALQGSNGPLGNCSTCHGSNMGGGNPHVASDSIPPNALLFVVLPFSISAPIFAFVAFKKKLWKRLNFSTLHFWESHKND
jgi:mono/diheme cytochrome c family protein